MKHWHVILIAASIVIAGAVMGIAQQTTPSSIGGCIYLATPPTLTNLQAYPFTCDINGKLRVTTTF